MNKNKINIILGIIMILIGMGFVFPVFIVLLDGLIKGYPYSYWNWEYVEIIKIVIGVMFFIIGITIFFARSIKKIIESQINRDKKHDAKTPRNWQKIIINFLPVLISVIALGVSWKSCCLSEKAIVSSTSQFFSENKPYITITLRKIKESQNYYDYKLFPEKDTVQIQLEYIIKNIGNIAAKDLSFSNELVTSFSNTTKPITVILPSKLTLGPGDDYVLGPNIIIKCENKDNYNKYVDKLSSEKGLEITLQFSLIYKSEINSEQKFYSMVNNKISKARAGIINMEYNQY
jgi:hypothetical protein